MPLPAKLKARKVSKPEPPWAGPEDAGPRGGVTQSLLSRFLSCRERFRVLVVEGLKPADRFNPTLEFGNMWHACEEGLASLHNPDVEQVSMSGMGPCGQALDQYTKQLSTKYPLQRDEIACWYSKCKELFPRYVEHWSKHPDVQARTPLLQEHVFHVPYGLPSGRTVYLRGKWDSVDLVQEQGSKRSRANGGIWIQENKTKSTIDRVKIERMLRFDLQSMIYATALIAERENCEANNKVWDKVSDCPFAGIRYNVIRRAAHKTADSMLEKFGVDSRNGRIEEWFARWNVEVSAEDVAKFKRQSLDPILESLCDWWDLVRRNKDPFKSTDRPAQVGQVYHYRTPFHYDPILDGGSGDVDSYLDTGSSVGLVRVETLFPELAEVSNGRTSRLIPASERTGWVSRCSTAAVSVRR